MSLKYEIKNTIQRHKNILIVVNKIIFSKNIF